jgi:hypothetical protein
MVKNQINRQKKNKKYSLMTLINDTFNFHIVIVGN